MVVEGCCLTEFIGKLVGLFYYNVFVHKYGHSALFNAVLSVSPDDGVVSACYLRVKMVRLKMSLCQDKIRCVRVGC